MAAGIVQRYRQVRARQRYMRSPSARGPGPLALLALLAVIAVVVYVSGLDRQERERQARRFELARAAAVEPLLLLTDAARTHSVVVLGDVLGAEAPKRFAADVIEALARGPGLDVVGLEVDADLQPRIDAYLEAREEDASLLLAHPRSVREWEGTGRAYLEIYRRVRAINSEFGAARRIRVVALDAPGWPPVPPPSPARLAQRFAGRAPHMAGVLEQRVLSRDDRARILVFVDGLQALRARARIETGGEVLDSVPLLAARLGAVSPAGPFTVLVGATAPPTPALGLAGYRPGSFFGRMGDGVRAGGAFGFLITRELRIGVEDIELWRGPGVSLEITPAGEPRPLLDAWVRLPG